jgi:DNA phosphorothioation-dependent restriction protein DptH
VAKLVKCLGTKDGELLSSGGLQISSVLSREVVRYIDFHESAKSSNGLILLHALRPGDGATVARALGQAFRQKAGEDNDELESPLRFNLELYPADSRSDVSGSFLVDLVERHRTGASGIAAEDRWMLQSQAHASGLTFPRLRWARKDDVVPTTSAHLALAFDSFETCVAFVPESDIQSTQPLHVYGLLANARRTFSYSPEPCWQSWLPLNHDGHRHPAGKGLTDRLLRLQRAVLKAAVRHAGRSDSEWPVLQTRLDSDQQSALQNVHDRADWVVTVDRYAGIEYFDSPRDGKGIYDAYVIDCVPERNDLGTLQMITSTTKTDEIRALLDGMLAAMGLSSSRKNCEFLVNQLKALSGRLAMRLSGRENQNQTSELIALSLLHAHCEAATQEDEGWLPLQQGFFIPVDDVPDLAPRAKGINGDSQQSGPAVRSDLIYVTLPARGGLMLTFVEVKYRRHLRTAREPQLLERIADQAEQHRQQWTEWYFNPQLSEVTATIRRSRLARAMEFYLEKAGRHSLAPEQYERLRDHLDRFIRQGADYSFSEHSEPTRGYVFCPDASRSEPEVISSALDSTDVRLFGPACLPDLIAGPQSPASSPTATINDQQDDGNDDDSEGCLPGNDVNPRPSGPVGTSHGETVTQSSSETTKSAPSAVHTNSSDSPVAEQTDDAPVPSDRSQVARIALGQDRLSDENVDWLVTSKANPHLMIVGLPGMGKTEDLRNICDQLIRDGITPIVFSYHPDIDERLSERLGEVQVLDHSQLGFNPMHVDEPTPHAHIDNAGMLRDIFGAMFPDLGDVQLERIRKSIRESYTRLGWGISRDEQTTNTTVQQVPAFHDFYELLQADPKPDRNLLGRLDELNDYGIFDTGGSVRTLLDSSTPSVLQIHATQNDGIQRAVAMLALYNIYKEMFRRGVQDRITHAIVFDEAHRASRLKLLPRLAAECRKFGLSLILASQSARDFDPGIYSQVASYLLLRMTEQDANILAKNITTSDQARRVADRLKVLEKYHALFVREGFRQPSHIQLSSPSR